MSAYMVTTLDTHGAKEPFRVIVEDERFARVAELDAMSPDHARMVAGALVLLLPKLHPGRSVVLDASLCGRVQRRPEIAA